MIRYIATALTVLTVVFAAALYAAAPYLVRHYLPAYLQTQGLERAEFEVGRPGLQGMSIDRLAFTFEGVRVEADDISLRYHIRGLLDRRLDELRVRDLTIVLPVESSGTGSEALPSPWTLIPVDQLEVGNFELISTAPAANLGGRFALRPSVADASFLITSELLPADLEVTAELLPTGEATLVVAPPGSPPVVSIHGQPEGAGEVRFDGDLQLDGAAFELALRLAGAVRPTGFIKGTFTGTSVWPPAGVDDVVGSGSFNVDFGGNVAGASGLSYAGPIDIFVESGEWRVESAGSTVGINGVEVSGGQYMFQDTSVGLNFRLRLPIADGVPELSLATGEADLELSVFLPGATPVSGALTLHDMTLAGDAKVSLNDNLHWQSRELSMAARLFDYENIRFQPGDERLDVALDLSVPRDGPGNLFAQLSGTLVTDVVTTISSSAADAPFQRLGLEAGVQVSIAGGRYLTSVASHSVVHLQADELDLGLETLNTIVVDAGPDGSISTSPGILSTRFSFALTDDRQLTYTRARLNLDSLVIDADDVNASGRFMADSSARALPLAFKVNGKLPSATGSFEISADHLISRPLFKNELPGWVADYELTGGRFNLSLSGTFVMSDEARFDVAGMASLERGVARYDELPLTGIMARLPLRIATDTILAGPGPVSIGAIDIGFPATDIGFQLETDTTLATMNDFTAQVLAATIAIDQLVYDIENEASQFSVRVAGLPVANVLALEGDDVEGTGILDGQLPVTLNKAGARVSGGSFSARAPGGYLRYHGDLPAMGMGLDLAIRALRNFEYTEMNVDVDYAPDGALAALVRLRGKSPNVEKGRPIHFNLNISEDVPALLESIRASEATERRVQQRLSR